MNYCPVCGNKLLDNNKTCPNCNSSNNEETSHNNKPMSIIFSIISLILVSPPYISMIVMLSNKDVGGNEALTAIALYELTVGIMINITAILLGIQSIKNYKENILAKLNIALALIPYILIGVTFLITFIKEL